MVHVSIKSDKIVLKFDDIYYYYLLLHCIHLLHICHIVTWYMIIHIMPQITKFMILYPWYFAFMHCYEYYKLNALSATEMYSLYRINMMYMYNVHVFIYMSNSLTVLSSF